MQKNQICRCEALSDKDVKNYLIRRFDPLKFEKGKSDEIRSKWDDAVKVGEDFVITAWDSKSRIMCCWDIVIYIYLEIGFAVLPLLLREKNRERDSA